MRGIAGVFLKQAPKNVERMIGTLTYRGPDGQGLNDLPNGTLGHIRLAILDLAGGDQPMGFDNIWITFNGEIYNYRELTCEYLTEDSLKTHSDTEVILHLYRRFGTRCVELLNGMFAFAIIDGNELLMARDPLGIKLLYYGMPNAGLYFASEIKALSQVTDDINEFPAGHWFHSRMGWYSYFRIESVRGNAHSESYILKSIRAVLKEAV